MRTLQHALMNSSRHGTLQGRVAICVTFVIACAALIGCERAVSPRVSRLTEIRRNAPDGYGSFTGRVLASDDSGRCVTTGKPVGGVRVDLGEWLGPSLSYRDTVTHQPPSSEAEPRFELLASTVTDHEGRFEFTTLPRRAAFAFRAVPGRESRWQLAYGASLFGLGNVDIKDHPRICVRSREAR
jgi:hypothetical protein